MLELTNKTKIPTPHYRLKLVIMMTMAKAINDVHTMWLAENEWRATVNGQVAKI